MLLLTLHQGLQTLAQQIDHTHFGLILYGNSSLIKWWCVVLWKENISTTWFSKLAIPSTIPAPLPPSIFNHCYEFIELVLVLHVVHQVIHIDFAKYLQIFWSLDTMILNSFPCIFYLLVHLHNFNVHKLTTTSWWHFWLSSFPFLLKPLHHR